MSEIAAPEVFDRGVGVARRFTTAAAASQANRHAGGGVTAVGDVIAATAVEHVSAGAAVEHVVAGIPAQRIALWLAALLRGLDGAAWTPPM